MAYFLLPLKHQCPVLFTYSMVSVELFVRVFMGQEVLYQLAAGLIPKIGPSNAKKLIAHLGSAEAIFREKSANLQKIDGIGKKIADSISKSQVLSRAEAEISFMERNGIKHVYYRNPDYPRRLRECDDGPIVLFYKGDVEFNQARVLSVVGTRKPTPYGKQVVEKLLTELAERGHRLVLVSGLAFGIDGLAHRISLELGMENLAVLAHGLDTLYPPEHREIAQKITRQGALVSEFFSGTRPDPQNFVRRNRIIAGLSDATLVVESAIKGGSLITAELAISYDREVLAIPGRITDEQSAGCNYLIHSNKAALIQSAKDLEFYLNWDEPTREQKAVQQNLFYSLSQQEQELLSELRTHKEMNIDTLSYKLKMPASVVASMLLPLEFSGFLSVLPGKIVRIN